MAFKSLIYHLTRLNVVNFVPYDKAITSYNRLLMATVFN